MQIVIDIPDIIYKISQTRTLNVRDDIILEKAVKNGIPLPKGHGRLIDADELEDEFGCGDRDIYAKESIREAQTIIEADNTESEE